MRRRPVHGPAAAPLTCRGPGSTVAPGRELRHQEGDLLRVFGLWLCFTALVLVAAPALAIAAPPAPDPAPSSATPRPDPAPASQPSAEAPAAPVAPAPRPVDARPVRVSVPTGATPAAPVSRPTPDRRPARRKRARIGATAAIPAQLQRATAWPGLPLKPAASEAADRGPLLRAAVGLLLLVAAGTASLRLMVRLAGPVLVAAAVLAGLPAAEAQAAPALTYACSPAPSHCLGWYRSSVTVRWDWDQLIAAPHSGRCHETRFTVDTATARASCEIRELADPFMTTEHTVPIRIDRVPPAGQGFTPSRPPDHGGWFNRPVTLSFRGSDSTSGVASCDSVSFGGPEGQAVPVSGSCRDRAGNVGTVSYPLAYDATPPAAPRARALPGHRRVRLTWSLPTDVRSVEVVRLGPRRRRRSVSRRGTRLHRPRPAQRHPLPLPGGSDRQGGQPVLGRDQRGAHVVATAGAGQRWAPQGAAAPDLEAGQAGAVLQRPALPRCPQGPQRAGLAPTSCSYAEAGDTAAGSAAWCPAATRGWSGPARAGARRGSTDACSASADSPSSADAGGRG